MKTMTLYEETQAKLRRVEALIDRLVAEGEERYESMNVYEYSELVARIGSLWSEWTNLREDLIEEAA